MPCLDSRSGSRRSIPVDRATVLQLLPLVGSVLSEKSREGWVIGSCPFAKWKHSDGVDHHPSFGIKVDLKSHYYCFSCGSHGDIHDLIIDLRQLGVTGDGLKQALQLVALEDEIAVSSICGYEELASKPVISKVVPFPEDWLASFKPAHLYPEALAYLATRGVSPKMSHWLGLRFDTCKQRVCFPIRDWDNRIVGLHGRLIHSDGYPYHAYKWQGVWNKLAWFGEAWADPSHPLLIVESVFDLTSCLQVYPNVMAALSAGLNSHKINRLSEFDQIVSFFDYGTGGDLARRKLGNCINRGRLIQLVPPPQEGDPGNMSVDQVADVLNQHLKLSIFSGD